LTKRLTRSVRDVRANHQGGVGRDRRPCGHCSASRRASANFSSASSIADVRSAEVISPFSRASDTFSRRSSTFSSNRSTSSPLSDSRRISSIV